MKKIALTNVLTATEKTRKDAKGFGNLTVSALAGLYNDIVHFIPDVQPVKKFRDKKTAIQRVKSVIADAQNFLKMNPVEKAEAEVKTEEKPEKQETPSPYPEELTGPQIVAIYNTLAGTIGKPTVKKFKNKTEGMARLNAITEEVEALKAMEAPEKTPVQKSEDIPSLPEEKPEKTKMEEMVRRFPYQEIEALKTKGKIPVLTVDWEKPTNGKYWMGAAIPSNDALKNVQKFWEEEIKAGNTPVAVIVTEHVVPEVKPPKKSKRTKKAQSEDKPVEGKRKRTRSKKADTTTPAPENKTRKRAKRTKRAVKYTRSSALVQALKESKKLKIVLSKDELVTESNRLYIENGGKDNIKESLWSFNNRIGVLVEIGAVKENKDGRFELII